MRLRLLHATPRDLGEKETGGELDQAHGVTERAADVGSEVEIDGQKTALCIRQ